MSGLVEFDVRQEDDQIATPKIMRVVLPSIVVAAVAVLLSGLLLTKMTGTAVRSSRAAHESAPAAGRVIANVEQTPIVTARDGLDLREEQRTELSRCRWVDRDAGVATIPIDEAIDLIVKEQR